MPYESTNPNSNPMPEVKSPRARNTLTWVSWAIALGGPSLAGFMAMMSPGSVKTALIIGLGLLTAIGAALKTGLSNPTRAVTILPFLLLPALAGGCANPAWIATAGVTSARKATDDGIAKAFRARHLKCREQHKPPATCRKHEACKSCVETSQEYKAIETWRAVGRPAVDAAILLTSRTLRIYEKASVKGYKWEAALLPAACAIVEIIAEFQHLFPDSAKSAMKYLEIVKHFTCKD